MKCAYDNGYGPIDRWVSFRNDDRSYRVIYPEADAVPIQFFKVDGKPNVYKMKQLWHNNVYWISHSDNGTWIYGRYNNEADAVPVLFTKHDNNFSFSSPGE